tara:strand:- start:324 stop:500 length:177 start_codon:yes stop_codon:yes gene_type:complete
MEQFGGYICICGPDDKKPDKMCPIHSWDTFKVQRDRMIERGWLPKDNNYATKPEVNDA